VHSMHHERQTIGQLLSWLPVKIFDYGGIILVRETHPAMPTMPAAKQHSRAMPALERGV
jgi:hypothetical protein